MVLISWVQVPRKVIVAYLLVLGRFSGVWWLKYNAATGKPFFFLSDSFSCFENVTVNSGVYDIEVWSYGVQNKLKNPRKFGNLNEIKLTEVYS